MWEREEGKMKEREKGKDRGEGRRLGEEKGRGDVGKGESILEKESLGVGWGSSKTGTHTFVEARLT